MAKQQDNKESNKKSGGDRNLNIPPTKNILIIVGIVIAFVFFLYKGFSSNTSTKDSNSVEVASLNSINDSKKDDTIIQIAPPSLPDPANDIAPPALPIALPKSDITPPPPPLPSANNANNRNAEDDILSKKRRSNMFINGGAIAAPSDDKEKPKDGNESKPKLYKGGNSLTGDSYVEYTGFEQVEATKVGDLSRTVLQGKMINAVLETAINTDHPGMIRAIVSHDTYSEMGNNVLIPKGSRLIGSYSADVKRGQSRVYIIWNRLIRPDGIDIAVGSNGTDSLGGAGMPGLVDGKFFEIFGNAILLSMVNATVATLTEKTSNSAKQGISQQTFSNGTTQTSGSLGAIAAQQSIANIGDVSKKLSEDYLNTKPTIVVNQGTSLNVFVQKDLIFPKKSLNSNRLVP